MEYAVYILQSEQDGSYYIGHTSDLSSRIERHNKGYERYTRKKLPWQLVWSRSFETKSEAYQLEMRLKKLKSRKSIEQFMTVHR